MNLIFVVYVRQPQTRPGRMTELNNTRLFFSNIFFAFYLQNIVLTLYYSISTWKLLLYSKCLSFVTFREVICHEEFNPVIRYGALAIVRMHQGEG
jgi:hypothetical protein